VLLPGPGFVRPERAYQVADVSGLLLKKDAVGILSRPVMVVGAVAYPATLRCWQGSKEARAAWSNPGGFSPGQGCGIIAVRKYPSLAPEGYRWARRATARLTYLAVKQISG
jgi:hypothetical protein